MALPPRPTAPAQALRSNPDTFSLNAELAINYQWTTFPDWIEAMGDFVVARAEEANAAALTGDITPAPEFAAHYLRLNSGGTALEYRSPTQTVGDLGQYGRNLIINGSGRINQRGYSSGAATSGANQFTLDRWFVVTSGQNLSFTGDNSARTMTAPAGGARQVIEGANVIGGSYVLNWTGTATATVNGTARTKGEVFTLTANTNVVVAFVGGTFTDVQLERGSVVTPFELRPLGQELALCQRYYEAGTFNFTGYQSNASGFGTRTRFMQVKPATPTIALSSATYTNASGVATNGISTQDFGLLAVASSLGVVVVTVGWTATSELTS